MLAKQLAKQHCNGPFHTPRFRYSVPARPRRIVQCHAAPKVAPADLLAVAKKAALAGSQVVMDSVNKPRQISSKEGTDIVTETDKASEKACIEAIQAAFPQHAILGEEGGVLGDVKSEYLWCIDPLDGTINFAHGYQSFCASVGVLRHATPVAGCVVEFFGGPDKWGTRVFTASRNNGAFCDDKQIFVSRTKELRSALLASELVWPGDAAWPHLTALYKEAAIKTRGLRMAGAAAADLCHIALGVIDGYVQYNLKPWDVAAGVIILEEAGGRVTSGTGLAYSVFDRSLLASNDALYPQLLGLVEPCTQAMMNSGVDVGMWCVPPGYRVRSGAQLE